MPKIKSKRIASKKLRARAKSFKRARSSTSHNSGKKPSKKTRQLRGRTSVGATHDRHVLRMLPNG